MRRQPGDYRRAFGIAVSNGLIAATDTAATIDVLRCSIRWAQVLTQDAREKAQAYRDAEIAAKAAEGKSVRQIAAEVSMPPKTVHDRLTAVQETHSAETAQPPPSPAPDPERTARLELSRRMLEAMALIPPGANPTGEWVEHNSTINTEAVERAKAEAGPPRFRVVAI